MKTDGSRPPRASPAGHETPQQVERIRSWLRRILSNSSPTKPVVNVEMAEKSRMSRRQSRPDQGGESAGEEVVHAEKTEQG